VFFQKGKFLSSILLRKEGEAVLEAITEVQLKVFLKIGLDLLLAYFLIGVDEVKR
jgi:hypothetical protein